MGSGGWGETSGPKPGAVGVPFLPARGWHTSGGGQWFLWDTSVGEKVSALPFERAQQGRMNNLAEAWDRFPQGQVLGDSGAVTLQGPSVGTGLVGGGGADWLPRVRQAPLGLWSLCLSWGSCRGLWEGLDRWDLRRSAEVLSGWGQGQIYLGALKFFCVCWGI